MKTIRITLTKEGAQATCTHRYRDCSWPMDSTWAGNSEAFRLPSGRIPPLRASLLVLEPQVAHQAALCGATYTIEDLGGEAIFSHDIVRGPADPADS